MLPHLILAPKVFDRFSRPSSSLSRKRIIARFEIPCRIGGEIEQINRSIFENSGLKCQKIFQRGKKWRTGNSSMRKGGKIDRPCCCCCNDIPTPWSGQVHRVEGNGDWSAPTCQRRPFLQDDPYSSCGEDADDTVYKGKRLRCRLPLPRKLRSIKNRQENNRRPTDADGWWRWQRKFRDSFSTSAIHQLIMNNSVRYLQPAQSLVFISFKTKITTAFTTAIVETMTTRDR